MQLSSWKYRVMTAMLAGLLLLAPGCNKKRWCPVPIAFGLGAWVASLFQSTEVVRECYQDGVQVDCDNLSFPVPPAD